MGIDPVHKKTFMRKRDRVNRMQSISQTDRQRLRILYQDLDDKMKQLPGAMIL